MIRERLIIHVLENISVGQLREGVLEQAKSGDMKLTDSISRFVKEGSFLKEADEIVELFGEIGYMEVAYSEESIFQHYEVILSYIIAHILLGDMCMEQFLKRDLLPIEIERMINRFEGWYPYNLNILPNKITNKASDVFGFPYLKQREFAMLKNTKDAVTWNNDSSTYFIGLGKTVLGEIVAIVANEENGERFIVLE